MPKAFSKEEERIIRERLFKEGIKKFGKYGLRKTTVEDLTAAVGISKGSFYKFFPSKEALFFDLLDQAQQKFKDDILKEASELAAIENFKIDKAGRLKIMFQKAVHVWENNPLSGQFGSEDLDYVFSRLPEGSVDECLKEDDIFSQELLNLCKIVGVSTERDPRLIAGLLRSVFLVSLHEDRYPEDIFPRVIQVLFDLIVDYIVYNNKNN
ncbi:MAG: TetR/AcrR family transcriptional regulator [Halanaerobiales bacterium]